MRAVSQRIAGSLLEENGRFALIMYDPHPDAKRDDLLFLRYAFVTRGPEDHIFPAFILDDWGREIRSLKLYRWFYEYGERFPRAEVFGYEQDGRETQCFLRELELYTRLPCYLYPTRETAVQEGVLLSAILLPDPSLNAPRQIKPPAEWKRPLRAARVSWWGVPAGSQSFDFSLLASAQTADP